MSLSTLSRLALAVLFPVAVGTYIFHLFGLLIGFLEQISPKAVFSAAYLLEHLGDHLAVLGLGLLVAVGFAGFSLRPRLSRAEEMLLEAVTGVLLAGVMAFIGLFVFSSLATLFILPVSGTGLFILLHLALMAGLGMLVRV